MPPKVTIWSPRLMFRRTDQQEVEDAEDGGELDEKRREGARPAGAAELKGEERGGKVLMVHTEAVAVRE
jgi:hypothetical protein